MNSEKHIGLNVYQATISVAVSVAVLGSTGKLFMESFQRKPRPFWSSLRGCAELYRSPSKKGLGPRGCTIYCSRRVRRHRYGKRHTSLPGKRVDKRFFASAQQQPDISWLANTGKQFVG
jgi:hypothetical protein